MINPYLLNRIRVMKPGEVLRRVSEMLLDGLRYSFRNLYGRRVGEQRVLAIFDKASPERRRDLWRANGWHQQTLDELLNGVFEAAGVRHQVGDENRWATCPLSGNRLDKGPGRRLLFHKMYTLANMKYVNTLNRAYHVVHLAKGAALGQIPEQRVLAEMEDWIDRNPYMVGVAWSDCLNTAWRVISWCFSLSILGCTGLPAKHSRSMHLQGLFLEQHLSFGSAAANHLLGELVGLFLLSRCLPDLPRADHWKRISSKAIDEQVKRQFAPDGFHFEHSMGYHRYVLETCLMALVADQHADRVLDRSTYQTLHQAARRLADCTNVSNEYPEIGDNGMHETSDPHYASFRGECITASTLALAAAVFDDPDLLVSDANAQALERISWLISEADCVRVEGMKPATAGRPSVSYPDAGLHLLRTGKRKAAERCVTFRCGTMGLPPLYGHAHADMLSFTLSEHGMLFLIDPGTYGYHAVGPVWREYFKGTLAHNTLSLDGRNQVESGGALIWTRPVDGQLDQWSGETDVRLAQGHHDSFGCSHHRRVTLTKSALEILDWLSSDRPERIYLHYHCHPEVEIKEDNDVVTLTRKGTSIRLIAPAGAGIECHKGEESPPFGWYSPAFGKKTAASTIRLELTLAPGQPALTLIEFTA